MVRPSVLRPLLLVVLVLGVGLLAWVGWGEETPSRSWGRPDRSGGAAVDHDVLETGTVLPSPPEDARLAGRGATTPSPPPASSVAGAEDGSGVGDAAGRPPGVAGWIEVTLDPPSDWPGPDNAVVYALPAGAPGAEEAELLPHADVLAFGEPLRFPVSAAGRWDVGFRCTYGHVLARDVLVEEGATASVYLTFPGWRPIEVRLAPGLLRGVTPGTRVAVSFRPPSTSGDAPPELPGRDQPGPAGTGVVTDGAMARTPSVMPGRTYAVRTSLVRPPGEAPPPGPPRRPSFRFVSTPDRVEAGGSVRITRLERGLVHLHLTYDGVFGRLWQGHGSWLHFDVQHEDAEASVQGYGVWVGPNHDPPMPTDAYVHADPGRVRIQWGSSGIHAGELPWIRVPPGGVVEQGVVIRIEDGPDVGAPSPGDVDEEGAVLEEVPVRIRGGPEGDEVLYRVFGRVVEGDRAEIQDAGWRGRDGTPLGRDWRGADGVQVVSGLAWSSRVTTVPLIGALDLDLEPAGLLLVAPAKLYPPELGAVRIRRVDGAPLLWAAFLPDDRVSGTLETAGVWASGAPGTFLGPLPAGRYAFEVWVGPLKQGVVEATVEPGRIGVLRFGD